MRYPHTATVVTPALAADAYGTADAALDYGAAASRRLVRAFIQSRDDSTQFDGTLRQADRSDWLLVTDDAAVTTGERVEWDGRVLDVTGVLNRADALGRIHHSEVTLRIVAG